MRHLEIFWKYFSPVAAGLLIQLVAFIGMFFVPLVALFVKWDTTLSKDGMGRYEIIRGNLPRWLAWFSTPDERLPGGLYEPTVKNIYDKYGRYWCTVYWLGWRNRLQGFAAMFGKPVDFYWPSEYGYFEDASKQFWWLRLDVYKQKISFKAGYRVYDMTTGGRLAVPCFTFTKA